jgi:hypothetical protein
MLLSAIWTAHVKVCLYVEITSHGREAIPCDHNAIRSSKRDYKRHSEAKVDGRELYEWEQIDTQKPSA